MVPTVTRVNSSVIGSGSYPSRTGIVGNSIFVPEVDPSNPFSTGEANNLTRLDAVSGGRLIFVKTLAERLQAQGLILASIGSGSSGGTLLLNPRAPRGVGYRINAGDETGAAPFTYPASIGEEITGPESGRGSFSPWDIRNTLIAWGTDCKDGVTVGAPAGKVDVAPTILALTGVGDGLADDGRVLSEALKRASTNKTCP